MIKQILFGRFVNEALAIAFQQLLFLDYLLCLDSE
jgi:hypothetical protein